MQKFNVIYEDINKQEFVAYDVMPYLRNCYKELKKKERPTDIAEMRKFVKSQSQYMWWSRTQFEIVLKPLMRFKTEEIKIDVHWQVMLNLDVIAQILLDEVVININHRQRKIK